MATRPQSSTLQAAMAHLNIDDADGTLVTKYQTRGALPTELLKHSIGKEYIMTGITPTEFMPLHGSATMDFDQLKKDFSKICFDYLSDLNPNTPSYAAEFCSKILYEVGPQARQVNKKDGDKTWKFVFVYATGLATIPSGSQLVQKEYSKTVRVAFVSTYKGDNAEYVPKASGEQIVLSVKNGSLLALGTLEKINMLAIANTPPQMLLTPLAGAVFSKDDIPEMASQLGGAEIALSMLVAKVVATI